MGLSGSLTVTTRADVHQLVSLSLVRTRLLDGDTSEDALLQALIDEVSQAIANHVYGPGANLARQSYSEVLAGLGRRRLNLSRVPVDPDSVTVTIDGALLGTTNWTVEDPMMGSLYSPTDYWAVRKAEHAQEPQAYITVAYKAGWILPDQIQTWSDGITLTAGKWIKPTAASLTPYLMEVTTGGTAGSTEPTWPTTTGTTVTDNTAVLTAREAHEWDLGLQGLAYLEIYHRYHGERRSPYLAQLEAEGVRESFFSPGTGRHGELHDLAPAVARGLSRITDLRAA